MRRGMEMGPALVAMLLIALFIVGLALWYGTGFAKEFGNRIQGFQSCESSVISTLGGDTALCSESSSCAGLSSDKTWQPLGEGWGCEGAQKYCCLSVVGANAASTQQIKEASCQEFKAGDIALIVDGRCVTSDATPRADEKLGVRVYMPQFKAPCSVSVNLDGYGVVSKMYNDCGASTQLGYAELFDGKTGYDLLGQVVGPPLPDLTRLNDGGPLTVEFKGAGRDEAITKIFHLEKPDTKACDDSSADLCKGKLEGAVVMDTIVNPPLRRACAIEQGYTCKLSDAVTVSGNPAQYVCIHIDIPSTEGGGTYALDDACKYADVSPDKTKDRRCYRDYTGWDYLCVRGPTPNRCIQETVRDGAAAGYPECMLFTQNIELKDWVMSTCANNAAACSNPAAPVYILYKYIQEHESIR